MFTGIVSTSVLFFLSQVTYNEIFVYAVAITLLSSMTGLLLEGKKHMYLVILTFSIIGILSIESFGAPKDSIDRIPMIEKVNITRYICFLPSNRSPVIELKSVIATA